MLMPKKMKYRKMQRGKFRKAAKRGTNVVFGDFGMIALEHHLITNRQIEATRRTITRALRREGKVWITIFPQLPYTKKPAETRMGNGKGNVDHYVARVEPGRVLFEIAGVDEEIARKAFWLATQKLPIKTKVIHRNSL